MIRPVEFPEVTSNQINTALLADKLNEVVRFLNERHPDPEPANAFAYSLGPSYRPLRDGVTQTRNGRYMLNGRFIRKDEAYAAA